MNHSPDSAGWSLSGRRSCRPSNASLRPYLLTTSPTVTEVEDAEFAVIFARARPPVALLVCRRLIVLAVALLGLLGVLDITDQRSGDIVQHRTCWQPELTSPLRDDANQALWRLRLIMVCVALHKSIRCIRMLTILLEKGSSGRDATRRVRKSTTSIVAPFP